MLQIKSNLWGHFMTNAFSLWLQINILLIAKVTRSINDNFQLVPHFMLVFVELYIFYTNKSRLPSRYIFYQLVEL
jgi:hypothetical protein